MTAYVDEITRALDTKVTEHHSVDPVSTNLLSDATRKQANLSTDMVWTFFSQRNRLVPKGVKKAIRVHQDQQERSQSPQGSAQTFGMLQLFVEAEITT